MDSMSVPSSDEGPFLRGAIRCILVGGRESKVVILPESAELYSRANAYGTVDYSA